MDKKHKEYCISLGNPYYTRQEKQYEKITDNSWNNFEIQVEDNNTSNLHKNSNKFTN